jgi:ribonuclease E
MTKRMLIDASHPEETRVVVLNDHQLEDFDFESTTKKQLKGNIYLAKVTRVEPSLQAAFVDYGGNRHGFLAFSEIHPDYFQIPQADRRLLEEANRAQEQKDGNGAGDDHDLEHDGAEAVATDPDEETAEVMDEQARRRSQLLRGYKIQEVIKRRQILLVQVVKEERGNKGAALTTYLSLAGRYCVLMPNTARGGGISRKISSPADRARLKAIARELDVPDGMGLIIRTAGQQRNKQEIRRDYDYLLRLWNDIRELTLESIAPCTIQEEGALVQRAIRDLYGRDVDEVLVDGEEGYRIAKKVMSMLMPSRARRVRLYKEDVPLFYRHGVEDRLDAMHSPIIQLRSGGSIVIHTTEALTAIDVNSGRSTRERNIEETALKTNLEAADEIARQLRLRDLAGLVVVDFIDMAEMRNQRAVERRLRDALKTDRARVQLGRISAFGLLELSRQRLRPSFQELSTQPCPTCHGVGAVRSTESAALQVLRAVEVEGLKGTVAAAALTVPLQTALYVLNQKRDRLAALEARYNMKVDVRIDNHLIAGEFALERTERGPEVEVVEAPAEAQAEAPAPAAVPEDDGEGKRRRRRRRRRKRPSDQPGEAEAQPLAARANGKAEGAIAEFDPAAESEDVEEAAQAMPEMAEAADAEPAPEPGPKRPRRRRASARRPRTKREAEPVAVAAEGEPVAALAESEADEPAGLEAPPPAGGAESAELIAEPVELEAETGARRETTIDIPAAATGEPRDDVTTPEASRDEEPEQSDEPASGPDHQGVLQQHEAPTDEEEGEEESSPEMPSAVVEQKRGGPPRRGWWSRFARKDD